MLGPALCSGNECTGLHTESGTVLSGQYPFFAFSIAFVVFLVVGISTCTAIGVLCRRKKAGLKAPPLTYFLFLVLIVSGSSLLLQKNKEGGEKESRCGREANRASAAAATAVLLAVDLVGHG